MAAGDKPEQFILDLPHRTALGRDDFLVTVANSAAVAAVERWPDWNNPVLILSRPHPPAAKAILQQFWQMLSGATSIACAQLDREIVPALLGTGALLIEDAPEPALDENALFHAINLAKELKASILITSQSPPSAWPITLPDLRSRLKAAGFANLDVPDDDLLRGLIVKQFSDRQIVVDEKTVSYMLSRMERSCEALRSLVEEIDKRAMSEKAAVTRSFRVARFLLTGLPKAQKRTDRSFIESSQLTAMVAGS